VSAVAPRDRAFRRAARWFGLAALGACSSAASVNERALLAGSELPASRPQLDPLRLIRPTQTEYRIGARDLLELDVYELEEPNKSKQVKLRVSQDGSVLVPLIGNVAAAGKTAAAVQAEITAKLAADYLVNPSVSLVVAEHQARRVTVLGAVQTPGTFHLKDNSTTLVDVLALSGGPNDKAGSTVYVVREKGMDDVGVSDASATSGTFTAPGSSPRLLKIDLIELVEHGDLAQNCILEDGDLVHVPPAAQFFVMGHVEKGGAFPLRGDITLLRAIALAGGLKLTATPSATTLIRNTPEGRVTIPLNLDEVEAGSTNDLLMQADDVLLVSESGGARVARNVSTFLKGLFNVSYGLR
jgi:polysaccharide biosynthesis/export protein